MGRVDLFGRCNELLAQELHMTVDSTEFRVWIAMAGWRRFEVAVRGTRLWMRPATTKQQAYNQLMLLLRILTPPKGQAPRRNALSNRGLAMQAQLDSEMQGAIDRDI